MHRWRRGNCGRGGVDRLTANIRATRESDAPFLPAVEQSAGQIFLSVPGLAWIAEDHNMGEETHAELARAGTSWVAVDAEDAPVGFIACERRHGGLHICEFAVDAALHDRGIGSALLGHAVDFARCKKLRAVTLTTFRNLSWNQPYYAKRGFITVTPVGDQPLAHTLRGEARYGLPRERRCAMVLTLA